MELDMFLRSCGKRYSSSHKAVQKLRSLGDPPASCPDDPPTGSPLQTALDIIASFAYNTTAEAINVQVRTRTIVTMKKHWSAIIDQWVRFFLDAIASSDANADSASLYGLGFFARLSYALAILSGYPDRCPDMKAEVNELRNASPYILHSIVRVWLKVLRWSHVTWMAWTGRMFRLIVADPEEISEDTMVALEKIQASKEQDVPKIFLGFLNQRTLRLGGMSELEANTTRMYIKMIGKFFDKQRRLYTPFLTGRGIHAYVNYLNTLVSRRKPLESVSDGSERFTIFYRCCCNIVDMLTSWLNGPSSICEAMDAGLIASLFHAERFHRHTPSNILEPKLDTSFCLVLKQIALFMVYPAVLRRFLRSKKRIAESGLEEKKLQWPNELRASWDIAVQRAIGLEEIRRSYEPSHASGMICGYSQCPRKMEHEGRNAVDRYLLCSSCGAIVYCSRACARKCWKEEHRTECPALTRSKKEGTPSPTTLDIGFFRMIIGTYTNVHGREIVRSMKEFAVSGAKMPTIPLLTYNDLGQPNAMALSYLRIVEFSSMIREYPLTRPQIENIIESSCSAIQHDHITLVALFPITGGRKESLWVITGDMRVSEGEDGEVSVQTDFQRMSSLQQT